ncbi:pro-resilin-like isoform X2 [Panulirus ornatus]
MVATQARPQGGYGGQGGQFPSAPARYSFQWDVDDPPSGNHFGHGEQRDGANTQGSYYIKLPDTRLMRVEYYVDQTGYHPTVTYEGEAQFPTGPQRGYYNQLLRQRKHLWLDLLTASQQPVRRHLKFDVRAGMHGEAL